MSAAGWVLLGTAVVLIAIFAGAWVAIRRRRLRYRHLRMRDDDRDD